MKRILWFIVGSGLMACSSSTTADSGNQPDVNVVDVANDTSNHDTGLPIDANDVAMTDDTVTDTPAPMDVAADVTDTGVHMCPATCTTPADCNASCPPATIGGWCCNGGTCIAAPVCMVPTDAGPDALVCTGAGQCDTTHTCPTGQHCCAPLPGLGGCGTCSPGVCPG